MIKAKGVDYRVTRRAKDTELSDEDFAFVFKKDGTIRCMQFPASLQDDDLLPYDIEALLDIIHEMELLKKVGRTYH